MIYRILTAGPVINHNADSIEEAIQYAKAHMPLKRGWKHIVSRSIVAKSPAAKTRIEKAVVSRVNSKGVEQKGMSASIVGQSAVRARQIRHVMSGDTIVCSCGNSLFYSLGRSLHSYNEQCSKCDRVIHPLTETGACN